MKAEEILPNDQNIAKINGFEIRKGTIGAFLENAKIILSSESSDTEKSSASIHLTELAPTLKNIGLFDIFAIKDISIRNLVESVTGDVS